MGILALGRPLVNPLHLGFVDVSSHVDPAAQRTAHLLGPLFYGQGQVLNSHLDFAGELLASSLEPKVVFT